MLKLPDAHLGTVSFFVSYRVLRNRYKRPWLKSDLYQGSIYACRKIKAPL